MLYVVASKYWKYSEWIAKKGLRNGKDVRYIQDARSFRGRRGDDFVLIGDYYTKENYKEIIDGMLIADFRCVYSSDYEKPTKYTPNILNLMKRSNLMFTVGITPILPCPDDDIVDQLIMDLM